jgi:hypothetical protein
MWDTILHAMWNRARVGLPLVVLVCVALVSSDAHADLGWDPFPRFFPMTRSQWNANRLGSGRRVEVWVDVASGRLQLHWEVAFEAADRANVFAVRQGAVDLAEARSECAAAAVYFEPDEHRPPGRPGRTYRKLGERHWQLHARDDYMWMHETVAPPMLPVSRRAWIFAPATAAADIGVAVGKTLLLGVAGIAVLVTGGR